MKDAVNNDLIKDVEEIVQEEAENKKNYFKVKKRKK